MSEFENLAEHSLQLDQQLCFPLYAASRLMTRRYKPYLDKLGITYPQYLVLMVLWQQDALAVKMIGEKLYLSSNTLTPLLKRLAALQLIERKRGVDDEREMYIYLTESGQALQQQALCVLAPFAQGSEQDKLKLQQLKGQLELLLEQLANEE
ncbi:MAG: MarR family transcriptional regulator [Alteromonadales bacterium]|nr:MarR family transcriptional regulator [Alteromonadales bacterium]